MLRRRWSAMGCLQKSLLQIFTAQEVNVRVFPAPPGGPRAEQDHHSRSYFFLDGPGDVPDR